MRADLNSHRSAHRSGRPGLLAAIGMTGLLGSVGCASDPVYIPGPAAMEAGVRDEATGVISEAKASIQLPIKTETADDARKRAADSARLDPVTMPYVRIGDLEIEVEWTIRNLAERDGQAIIEVNGANEYFSYDPALLVLDPEDEEAPPTPGLDGDIPLDVAAGARISGLFTEDQLREAAIDLDQITRGNVNPFAANLTISKNAKSFQPMTPPMPDVEDYEQTPTGPAVPREAFAGMTRIDLVFRADVRMVLEYAIRIRDMRGIVHDLLLTAETEAPDELQVFEPMEYTVAAPVAP